MTTDVGLTEEGDLPAYTEHIDGLDLVVQKVRIRLHTFAGEWILDTSQGLPIFDWIEQKPVRLNEIENHLRAEITSVDGVSSLVELTTELDRNASVVRVNARVDTVYGTSDLEFELNP